MTCVYVGCTNPCNFMRCRAHTALFTAFLKALITEDQHYRLAKLPARQMLRELPAAMKAEGEARDIVLQLIEEAQ